MSFCKAAWPHRDQKLTWDPQRDAAHVRRVPNAFSHGETPCIQSSLYLTDCDTLAHETFAFCPGSHLWPDEPNWTVSGERHQVTVDPKDIMGRTVKLAAKAGDLVLWYSTTIHWGHPGVSARAKIPLWRKVSMETLRTDGVCIVPLLTPEEVETLKAQFVEDGNALYRPAEPYTRWDQVPTIGSGKAGSAAPPLTLSKWAWDARLHPKRVRVFRDLLGEEDLCVGLDSVHFSPSGGRLCSMASFSPKRERTEAALKRKCVAAAWGRWRMTHWAAHGDLSRFCYGSRFAGPRAFAAADPSWVGWASASEAVLLNDATFWTARGHIERLAASMTLEDAKHLVKADILDFL